MSKKEVEAVIKAERHIQFLEKALLTPYDFETELIQIRAYITSYNERGDKGVTPRILTSAHKLRGFLKRNPSYPYQQSFLEKDWL